MFAFLRAQPKPQIQPPAIAAEKPIPLSREAAEALSPGTAASRVDDLYVSAYGRLETARAEKDRLGWLAARGHADPLQVSEAARHERLALRDVSAIEPVRNRVCGTPRQQAMAARMPMADHAASKITEGMERLALAETGASRESGEAARQVLMGRLAEAKASLAPCQARTVASEILADCRAGKTADEMLSLADSRHAARMPQATPALAAAAEHVASAA